MDPVELPQVSVRVAVKNRRSHRCPRLGGVEREVTRVTGDDVGLPAVIRIRDCDAHRAHDTLGGAIDPRPRFIGWDVRGRADGRVGPHSPRPDSPPPWPWRAPCSWEGSLLTSPPPGPGICSEAMASRPWLGFWAAPTWPMCWAHLAPAPRRQPRG